jgi:hypothetical protein
MERREANIKLPLSIFACALGLSLVPTLAAANAQPKNVILHNQADTFVGNVVCSPTGPSGLITINYNAVVVTNSLPDGTSIFHRTQGGGVEIAHTSEGIFTATSPRWSGV